MYYRSQGYRHPRDMRIPINYSGNAFSEPENNTEIAKSQYMPEEEETEDLPSENTTNEPEENTDNISNASKSEENEAKDVSSLFRNSNPSSLFGGQIGSEELLILAIVFLLSDTDSGNDIIWLLLLLLFIK